MTTKLIKRILLILGVVTPAFIFANYSETQDYFTPTQQPELKSYTKDWKTKFEWTKAENQDFSYYKLVYSNTNENPVYPNDWYVFVGTDIDTNSSYQESKNWYWRMCIIYKGFYANNNDEKYRKCSNVIKIENSTTTSTKNTQKQQKTEKKVPEISDAIKTKLDTIIQNFKTKIDTKLTTNEEKIKTINSVLEKLQSKRSSKIYMYVINKIKEIKNWLQEDTNDIEKILDF